MMNYQDLQSKLFENAEEGYRDFVLGGIITERPLLGVRVPKCREIAKEIVATPGYFDGGIEAFLKNEPVSFEEVLIRGFVIANLPYEEMVAQMDDFIRLIDNWEVCDVFCAAMKKNIKKNREIFLDEIDRMLKSLDEFQTRVALVCLLDHYAEADYLTVIFDRIDGMAEFLSDGPGEMSVTRKPGEVVGTRVAENVLSWDAYYVKMAVAWLISVCFVKFPEETMQFFKQVRLPKWTFNKTILKTCESYRVDKDLKEELKELKKKREKVG